jgi:gliding motility-associated lipoprotein GldB
MTKISQYFVYLQFNIIKIMSLRIIKLSIQLVFIIFLMISCKKEPKGNDVSSIDADVNIVRFDQIFGEANENSISEIKAKYPYLFPEGRSYNDWLAYKNDTIFQELYQESQKVFGDFDKQKNELNELFKHVKYFYPSFKEPEVYTIISSLDIQNQVIYADSLLFISLDTYLGKSKIYYADSPDYIQKNFEPQRIPIDVATAIAHKTIPQIPYRTFIEQIIALGKQRYTIQQFLPGKTEAEILSFDEKQIEWAKNNEYYMWQYFMEKEYLYSSDKDLQRRFIDIAPFSKFYVETDSESPGQIGIWVGLQIVKSYMEYNEVTLPQLMATPPMDIFNKSKYKPAK